MNTTTFLGMKKPGTGDTANISDINYNTDIIDERIKNATLSFAKSQETDNATVAISAGEYVMWKGVLTKAAEDLGVGDSLNATRLPAVKFGAILKVIEERFSSAILKVANGGSGMSAPTSGIMSYKGLVVDYYKWGRIVTIKISGKATATIAKGTAIVTLPAGYRPPSSFNAQISFGNNSADFIVSIYADGRIQFKQEMETGRYPMGVYTYIVNS